MTQGRKWYNAHRDIDLVLFETADQLARPASMLQMRDGFPMMCRGLTWTLDKRERLLAVGFRKLKQRRRKVFPD